MPELPARNISDVHLADLFDAPGCPLCSARARATDRYLEGWLWESVNDVTSRAELDASRGLCPLHVQALLASDRGGSGSMVGSAILLDAMLRVRRAELERATSGRGRGRNRALAEAARAPDCAVCEHVRGKEATTIAGFLAHLEEPAWAAALGTARFCLSHLLRVAQEARRSAGWEGVERAQLARLTGMHARLRGFLQHSSHDTRHLRTVEEVAAIEEVAQLLGPDPGGRWQRAARRAPGPPDTEG
jgi:hypothetical protein